VLRPFADETSAKGQAVLPRPSDKRAPVAMPGDF